MSLNLVNRKGEKVNIKYLFLFDNKEKERDMITENAAQVLNVHLSNFKKLDNKKED
ncbi:hypothetical protein M3914_003302 [Vibrio metschnikovii]|nr:hypothetical protein [Vibrio metschnikovii]